MQVIGRVLMMFGTHVSSQHEDHDDFLSCSDVNTLCSILGAICFAHVGVKVSFWLDLCMIDSTISEGTYKVRDVVGREEFIFTRTLAVEFQAQCGTSSITVTFIDLCTLLGFNLIVANHTNLSQWLWAILGGRLSSTSIVSSRQLMWTLYPCNCSKF